MNNTVLTVWPLLYLLVLVDVLHCGYMPILVIRKARLREVESLVQGHPSPIPPNSLHHFKGFCLQVAHVTSTHVSLAEADQVSLWTQVGGKGSATMCLEGEESEYLRTMALMISTRHRAQGAPRRKDFVLLIPKALAPSTGAAMKEGLEGRAQWIAELAM